MCGTKDCSRFETRLIPDALNKRDGGGGYVEARPKYLPFLLNPLLNLRPLVVHCRSISNDTTLSGQRTQGFPYLIRVSGPAIRETNSAHYWRATPLLKAGEGLVGIAFSQPKL
jgi:hypothetical protein